MKIIQVFGLIAGCILTFGVNAQSYSSDPYYQFSCELDATFTYEICGGKVNFINNSTFNGLHLNTIVKVGYGTFSTSKNISLGEDFSVQYPSNGAYTVCINVFGYIVKYDGTLSCCNEEYCLNIDITEVEEPCETDGGFGGERIKSESPQIHKSLIMFTLFPNPVKNDLEITLEEENSNIKIFSSKGRLILSLSNINEMTKVINMNNLPSGLYFITVDNGTKIETKKVIKQ